MLAGNEKRGPRKEAEKGRRTTCPTFHVYVVLKF
jgi:hypothetical protein